MLQDRGDVVALEPLPGFPQVAGRDERFGTRRSWSAGSRCSI
jgi:hypothetical protein